MRNKIGIFFILVLTVLFTGCLSKDKTEKDVNSDIVKQFVVEKSGEMTFGTGKIYDIYSVKIEFLAEKKSVKIYFTADGSENGILPTDFDGTTAIFDKNILTAQDGTEKELFVTAEDEEGNAVKFSKKIK
jgi:hypothetical protein